MNVIHVNSDYGNTIYKYLSESLFKLDVEQRVYKFIRPSMYKNDEYDSFVDVSINHENIDRYFFHTKHKKVYNDFKKYIENKNVDLLHAHTLFSNGYIAYKTFLEKKIPYVVAIRNTDINIFFKYILHLRRLGIDIMLNASKIIFISPAHKKSLFKKYIPYKYKDQLEKKTIIIPNGIDNYYFQNANLPKSIDNKNDVTILTAAWINKNKNQLSVCRAIQILNNKGYNINYRIVGGIEKENTYQKLVKELESFSFTEIVPRKGKEELINEYRKSDIFAMVSYKETFGLSYIESLLQCTPIVYTKGQGVDGYFVEGDVGFSANPNSPTDIANKIEMILKNFNRISKKTTEIVQDFKWDKVAKQYLDIYEVILKE